MTGPRDQLDQEPLPGASASGKEKPQQASSASGMGLLARVSTLAWNLVIPIVGGVLLGYFLDQRSGDSLTWTLSLLVLGVIIAFSNLYNLYIEQGREKIDHAEHNNQKQESHEEEK